MNEKKLTRPQEGRVIGGVCAGFGRFFGIDETLIRLVWVFTVLCVGTGLLAYAICWIVIPEEESA